MANKVDDELSVTAELIQDEDVLKFRSQIIDDELSCLLYTSPSPRDS